MNKVLFALFFIGILALSSIVIVSNKNITTTTHSPLFVDPLPTFLSPPLNNAVDIPDIIVPIIKKEERKSATTIVVASPSSSPTVFQQELAEYAATLENLLQKKAQSPPTPPASTQKLPDAAIQHLIEGEESFIKELEAIDTTLVEHDYIIDTYQTYLQYLRLFTSDSLSEQSDVQLLSYSYQSLYCGFGYIGKLLQNNDVALLLTDPGNSFIQLYKVNESNNACT